MRLNEGKIGMQESASIAAVAITACSVFLLDSEKALFPRGCNVHITAGEYSGKLSNVYADVVRNAPYRRAKPDRTV